MVSMETNLSLRDSKPSLLSRTCLQSQAAEAKIERERKKGRRTIQPCGNFIELEEPGVVLEAPCVVLEPWGRGGGCFKEPTGVLVQV